MAIDDLARPKIPLALKAFNAVSRPFAHKLFPVEEKALLRLAQKRTGLDDFGSDGFRRQFSVFIRALNNEAQMNTLGRFNTRVLVLSMLEARLKAEQLMKDHPEILETPVNAPIIIYGLPRTGTTMLQRLIAQDEGLRHLRYWESDMPMPLGDPSQSPKAPDPRIRRAKMKLALLYWAAPQIIAMHELEAEAPDEELWLMGIDFATQMFEGGYSVPSYSEWFQEADLTESYRYLYKMLQVLQWYKPGERWILKSPQHLGCLRELMAVFPDATFVQTHRDPCTAVASILQTLVYAQRFNTDRPDPVAYGKLFSERLEHMLRRSIEDRPPNDPRFVDVHFRELVKDPIATVRGIYERAGRALTSQTEQAMRQWLEDNPAGRHGKHEYRLEDFGLDHAERRKALRFYSEHFSVPDDKTPQR